CLVYYPVDHAAALPQNQGAVQNSASSVYAVPTGQPLPRHFLPGLLFFALVLALTGCHKHSARVIPPEPPPPEPAPTVKNHPAPTVGPMLPAPAAHVDPNAPAIWTQVGWASWYGPNYNNKQAANGEIYDQNQMTAAHNTL